MVMLEGRVALSILAIRIAVDLESRGVRLTVAKDGQLIASPRHLLRDEDYQLIHTHAADLRKVVAYCQHAPEVP